MIPSKLLASGVMGKTADGKKCIVCYKTEAQVDMAKIKAGEMTKKETAAKWDICFVDFMLRHIHKEHRKHSKDGASCQRGAER